MVGVATIGQIEPFNQYQRNALMQLGGSGIKAGQNQLNAATAAATGAVQPFNMDDYNTRLAGFMNPYQQQVVNSTIGTINEQAAGAKNALTAAFGGRANRGGALSFGDSSSAIQLAELEKNRLGEIGRQAANLNYGGFNNASQNAIGTIQNDVSNALSGAQVLSGLGGQARQFAAGDISNQLLAGNQIQGQNQNALTAAWNEYQRRQNYGQNQLTTLAQNLNAFPSGIQGASAPNTAQTLGGLTSIASQIPGLFANTTSGGGGTAMMANALGGFVPGANSTGALPWLA